MVFVRRFVAALTVILLASSCSPECDFQVSVGELLLGKNPSGLTQPVSFVYYDGEVLPDDLDSLARQTSVECLFIKGSVTDSVLEHLSELRNLRSLTLRDASGVTDEGLRYLRELTRLRVIDIRNSRIAGPGLKYLKSLTVLRHLGPKCHFWENIFGSSWVSERV